MVAEFWRCGQRLRAVWAALIVLLVAACSSGPIATGTMTAVGALGQPTIEDYRVGPGDRLRISVFNEENLSGEFVVAPSGTVAFPLVGALPAQGQTIPEFTTSLSQALSRYVREPSVVVEVMNYRPFYILGEVRSPSTYPYTSGLTVLNAVATAGGFTDRANTQHVYIKHANEAEERDYRLTTTTPVQPGDTVRIPERRF